MSHVPPPQDYSIGLLVRYGNFSYFTGGDINGVYSGASNDVEAVVAAKVGGPVDVLRANGFGAATANSGPFVSALSPQLSLLNCGQVGAGNLPDQAGLDRLLASSDVFMFHYCNEERDYGDAIVVTMGELHIVSEDGGRTFALRDEDRYYTYTSGAAEPPEPPPPPPPPPGEWMCAGTTPPCNTCEPCCRDYLPGNACDICVQVECESETLHTGL